MDKELQALVTILESALKSENKEAVKEGIEKVISKIKGTTKKTENNGMKNSVIPYKRTPMANENAKWDASEEVKNADGNSEMLYTMHAYVNRDDDNFNESEAKWYKLPHHRGSGEQEVVWKAVSSAVAAMRGARGGVDIPEEDRAGVMAHLRKHYEEFDKEFPEEDENEAILILGLSEDKNTIYQIDSNSNSKVDGNIVRAQVLKIKKLIHRDAKGGVLNITKESIKKIIKNFKEEIIDNVYVPLGHTNDVKKNTGKVIDLIATEDGMDAVIEIRDKSILQKLKDGLIEKVSASIDENYLNKETGKFVGPVLRHIALVSEPYIKGMNKNGFVFLEEGEDKNVVVLVEETSIKDDLKIIKDTFNNAIETIVNKLDKDNNMDINNEKEIASDEVIEETEEKIEKSDEIKDEKATEDESSNEESSSESEDEKSDDKIEDNTEEDKKSEESSETDDQGDEATEDESESVDNSENNEEVNLAEAEKEYNELLNAGKVLPVQKNEIISLLASKGTVNLSDGEKSISELVKSLLNKQKSLDFEEKGAENTDQPDMDKAKAEAEAERVKGWYKKSFGYSDEEAQVAFEEFSRINEGDSGLETSSK